MVLLLRLPRIPTLLESIPWSLANSSQKWLSFVVNEEDEVFQRNAGTMSLSHGMLLVSYNVPRVHTPMILVTST